METENITVSVVVITYNQSRYIGRALDSILNQKTGFDYEILIGDDCSTDGTSDIVRDYEERFPHKIKAFIRTENIGPTKNLYETSLSAAGKYIASCEGDDFWTDENKLQLQVELLEAHPEYSGCVHPVGIVDENNNVVPGGRLKWINSRGDSVFSLKDFKGVFLPGHGASMMKRNYFTEKDFPSDIIYKCDPNLADRTISLLWLWRGDFYVMPRQMACYRKVLYGNNLTSRLYTQNPNKVEMDYNYTVKLEGFAESHGIDAGFRYHKRDLFAKALFVSITHPSRKNFGFLCRMLKEADSKSYYIFGIIPSVFSILKRRLPF